MIQCLMQLKSFGYFQRVLVPSRNGNDGDPRDVTTGFGHKTTLLEW